MVGFGSSSNLAGSSITPNIFQDRLITEMYRRWTSGTVSRTVLEVHIENYSGTLFIYNFTNDTSVSLELTNGIGTKTLQSGFNIFSNFNFVTGENLLYIDTTQPAWAN